MWWVDRAQKAWSSDGQPTGHKFHNMIKIIQKKMMHSEKKWWILYRKAKSVPDAGFKTDLSVCNMTAQNCPQDSPWRSMSRCNCKRPQSLNPARNNVLKRTLWHPA
jgi:hypothetical protein